MPARQLRMLAACERSGRVASAFAKRGWEAWSCDLEPSDMLPHAWVSENFEHDGVCRHHRGDVLEFMATRKWDLVIAFPPCTDISSAGARYWKEKDISQGGDGRMQWGAKLFMDMIYAPAPHVAVENPMGKMNQWHRYPDQVVEPWWFGDPYSKKTCLWLRNLPMLVADNPVAPVGRVATGGGSWRTDRAAERVLMSKYEDSRGRVNREYMRSLTFEGFARAMADQWGPYIEKETA